MNWNSSGQDDHFRDFVLICQSRKKALYTTTSYTNYIILQEKLQLINLASRYKFGNRKYSQYSDIRSQNGW